MPAVRCFRAHARDSLDVSLDMHATVLALTLAAAALHAIWNALLRSGQDQLWSVTAMSFATTAIAIPAASLLPVPLASCWSYIGISAVLQVGYSISLARAYRHGELGQVYPIIRGSVPLLVTLGGFALAGQQPSRSALVGIALVSAGIASLSFSRARAGTRTIALALVTALFVASYVTADGIGVRLAGNSQSYAAWIFVTYGALMPLAFFVLRRRLTVDLRTPETLKAMATSARAPSASSPTAHAIGCVRCSVATHSLPRSGSKLNCLCESVRY